MKHIYVLMVALLTSVATMAQSPIITAIVDGDCTGGTPKVLEIYASGTVDFTQYSVEIQTNAGTTWGSTFSLADFGTRTNSFVYLTTNLTAGNSNTIALASEFPGITAANVRASSATNFNGDDRVRIIDTSTMAVIDQYGAEGVDGTGEIWEYTDGFAKRISGTGPDAGFNFNNWTYSNGGLNTFGTCQGGPDTFQTLMGGIGTYSTVANTNPTLSITSPTSGATLDNGNFSVTLNVTNFTVAQMGGSGYIKYQLDATPVVNKFDTTPIVFTNVASGMHTIKVDLVNNSGAALSPAVSQTITVNVSQNIQVQNIAALRAVTLPSSAIYTLSNEVLVTFTQSFRNQKWIEDTSAAIVIDDSPSQLTTTATIGDGLTGLSGRLNEFNGLLQFNPIVSTLAPSSTGNTITPQIVTIAMLNANSESYESEFVQVQGATFTNANGVVAFANNTIEPFTVAAATFNLRPQTGADYIGTVVPAGVTNIAGYIGQSNTEYTLTPRTSADISTLSVDGVSKASFNLYPNPVSNGIVAIAASNGEAMNVTVYSMLGQPVAHAKNVTSTLDVSNLNAGIYLVQITQGSNSQTRKLVVE